MKKNNFAEEYAKRNALRAAYQQIKDLHDEDRNNALREELHALMASIKAKGSDYADLYDLYEDAHDRGNEFIDLNRVIWDDKVEGLIKTFRDYGIERFTFSSGWSSAVETAWLFTQNGCTLEGLVEINGTDSDFFGEGYERVHAYVFRVN